MSFSATVNLGTVGVAITSVKLYGCTGNNGTNCTGCTALTGYENVGVNQFPLLVSGIPNGSRYIQAEALGACSADAVKQCISISGIPGPTATPAPTMTLTPTGTSAPGATPNPTNTQTPTPTPTPTPTGTSAPGATPNPTNTPTPSATQGCVPRAYNITNAGNFYWKDCNGIDRYNYFTTGDSPICICRSTDLPVSLDGGTGTLAGGGCECNTPSATQTQTPTPTATPNFYGITVNLQGFSGSNGNLQIWQSPDNSFGSFTQSLSLTCTDNEFKSEPFNGTPGYYYYLVISRTSGTAPRLNVYTAVNPSDFNPGGITLADCTSNAGTTSLTSDIFQLPNPIQYASSIIFYGGLNEGCL
jgi:hypothetical protein